MGGRCRDRWKSLAALVTMCGSRFLYRWARPQAHPKRVLFGVGLEQGPGGPGLVLGKAQGAEGVGKGTQ